MKLSKFGGEPPRISKRGQWIISAVLALFALGALPSLTSILFVIAAILAAPIDQIRSRIPTHMGPASACAAVILAIVMYGGSSGTEITQAANAASEDQRPSTAYVNLVQEAFESSIDAALSPTSIFAKAYDEALPPIEDKIAEAERAALEARLAEATIDQTTTVLEYSDKETDPVRLVTCSDADVVITAQPKSLSLEDVGDKTVTYTLSLGDSQRTETLSFTVRDTKSPQAEFVADEIEIDQGDTIDPKTNVKSVLDPVDGELAFVESEPEKIAQSGRQYENGWYTISSDINSSTPGTYYVKVTACDKHGNRTEREFKVTVNEVIVEEPEVEETAEPARNTRRYILNTNTGKFHNPGCRAVGQMKESNKWDTDEYTRDEIIAMGYSPCGICNP